VIIALISLGASSTAVAQLQREVGRNPNAHPSQTPAARAFTLVDPSGRAVTDRDFRGRFTLIYFGYTTCASHCPMTLAKIAAAFQALGPSARHVQPIFVTVDPNHDPPKIVGRFAHKFSQRILGLTGSPAQIEAVEKVFGVEASYRRTGPKAAEYVIDHPSVVYLVGPDGQTIAQIPTDGTVADLVAAIRRYSTP
jgi:protein SCO1/2